MEGFHFIQTFINRHISTIETACYTGIYEFLEHETENILCSKNFEIIHTFFVIGKETKTISYYFVETGLTEEEKLFLIKNLSL